MVAPIDEVAEGEMEIDDDGEDAKRNYVRMDLEMNHHHHDHDKYDQVQYDQEQKLYVHII